MNNTSDVRRGGRAEVLAHKRVLVVDDEDDARELLRYILEDCRADVVDAPNVAEALEQLQSTHIDVIVSDIGMPGRDGYSFIRELRSHPRTRSVPALALTAFARKEDRARALNAGFNLHLAKPFDPTKLLEALAELVERPWADPDPTPIS